MEIPLQEDWEALIELLNDALKLLGGDKIEPSRLKLLEFSNTAAMLGVQDLASVAVKLQEFLVNTIKPQRNDEAVGTLNFALAALIEKMQIQQYGPEFSAGLSDVLLFLDYYSDEADAPVEPADLVTAPEAAPEAVVETSGILESSEDLFRDLLGTQLPAMESGVPSLEIDELFPEVPIPEPAIIPVSTDTDTAVPAQEAGPQADAVPLEKSEVSSRKLENGTGTLGSEAGFFPMSDNRFPTSVVEPDFEEAPATQIGEQEESLDAPAAESGASEMDIVQLYRMMLEFDPASQVFVALAEELYSRGLWKEAAEACRGGLVFHPRHLRAKALLGCALWDLGEAEEAELVLVEARSEMEKNAVLYEVLAEIAEARGESHRARSLRLVYESLRMDDRLIEPPAVEAAGGVGEMEPEAGPVESPSVAFLSALMARFEGERHADGKAGRKLFATEDREVLKRIMLGGVQRSDLRM